MLTCNMFTCNVFTRKMLTRKMLTRNMLTRNMLTRKVMFRKDLYRRTLSCNFCPQSCPVKSCPAKYCPAKLKIWSKLVCTPCNSVVVDSSSNLQFLYFLERKNPQSRKKCTILKPLKRWLNLLFEKKIFNFLKKVGLEKIEKFEIGKNLGQIFNLQILHKTVVKNTWAPEQILLKEKLFCKANKKS